MEIYSIAHTWKDSELTVTAFASSHKALKYIGEHVDEGFRKPNLGEEPSDYVQDYYAWGEGKELQYQVVVEKSDLNY